MLNQSSTRFVSLWACADLRIFAKMIRLARVMEDDVVKLNDPAVLPPHAYRRNHLTYELVTYVNCLVGCRISGNLEGASLFENRIRRFMVDHPQTPDVAAYYEVVAEYVRSAQ